MDASDFLLNVLSNALGTVLGAFSVFVIGYLLWERWLAPRVDTWLNAQAKANELRTRQQLHDAFFKPLPTGPEERAAEEALLSAFRQVVRSDAIRKNGDPS